ncbi:MAG: tripartite tricarboxylate transporter substrate binding protein [Betaproteobacteria bacterium]|nr:tripartite tricarboxylate transporter substrate binding protein [Betaproteobacteria bacterium]
MQQLLKLIAGLALALTAASTHAQAWPSKPIRYIVPFAPGGTTDILARTVGDKLAIALGQPVVIENKPGAGGGVGAEITAKSAPDGYTIMGGTISTHAINASLYKSLPYDPVRDFAPIVLVARVPNMLVVHPDVPAKNVAELVALLRANPGKYTFASAGNGTSQHLSGELFKSMAGAEMQHVPYKGSPPALQDVMGGQVSMTFDNITTAWPLAKGGKLRALAVTTAKRSAIAPDVPTLAEAGLPGFEVGSWQGVFAPAGTPPDIVKRLNAEIVKILNTPDVRDKLAALGAEVVGNSPEEFSTMVKAEVVKWADVVKKSGARVD